MVADVDGGDCLLLNLKCNTLPRERTGSFISQFEGSDLSTCKLSLFITWQQFWPCAFFVPTVT